MTLRSWGALPVLVLVWLLPEPPVGYIGPGAGLAAIGTLLAVFAGMIVAVFGFVWYPIKRLRRKMKAKDDVPAGDGE